jgi:type II secretory pathway component PulK
MIFVTALGIIVILTGLALVFAQEMRTEALASANRRSQAQADSIELGAEQWVLAQVEAYQPDAMTITQVQAEAIQVGSGYFWITTPDPDSDQQYMFGITDESGKLNINSANAQQLMSLPCDLQQDTADAITDWRNTAARGSADGAESDYYSSLTEPYIAKNAPYETVEELLLVSSSAGDKVTPQLLWGTDLNRNGIIEDAERQSGALTGSFTGASGTIDGRGIYNYLTCYSTQPRQGNTPASTGAVNINTASDVVLQALGMSQNDAESIISQREGNDYTNTNWARSILQPYGNTLGTLTGQSYQYSADIVAVSGDGRAFRRVRIVVDARTLPAKIVYRKDLTSFGWPFPQSVRKALMAGQTVGVGSVQQGMATGVTSH